MSIDKTVHEECGVFGIISPDITDVANYCYYGLYALQHRGQEGCGIVVNDDGVFKISEGENGSRTRQIRHYGRK